ncbi:MAG: peptide chain release factor N(5)-glutamine methyltransferase [Bacteroidetes bacterium]|nr:MAG: peptide chain release factor N(5)-glutamine methyltransferase [Bacteroidota bacterium]
MFVQTNSLSATRKYFNDRLSEKFSSRELRSMFNLLAQERLGLSSADLILQNDQLLSESDLLFFRSAVKKLQSDEPFQHILGKTEFMDLSFITDKRALIPRPETEELVRWILEDHQDKAGLTFLDLCSGSGCISISLDHYLTLSKGYAIEYSEQALALSRENNAFNKTNIDWLIGDVLGANVYERFSESSFDFWVSNPPYVLYSDKSSMSKNVLDHEPHMALFVEDNDPLIFYRKISVKALRYLKQGGKLYFEIHEEKGSDVCELLTGLGFKNVQLNKDLQGKERMVRAEKH